MSGAEVVAAEARAAEARRRLDGTVERLQTELQPSRLARVALAEVSEGSERVAKVGADAARRNPGMVAGGAGLLAAMVVGRGIVRLFGKKKRRKQLPPPEDFAQAERIGS